MGLFSKIRDGWGTGSLLKISNEGAANVVVHPHPPVLEDVYAIPFREYMVNSASSSDMNVNGSTTEVDFYVTASSDYDIYINQISVEIGDGGSPALNKFGDLSALTNGVFFYWKTLALGEYELHEGIKTNKEFIRIGAASAGFGDGANAFLADVSGGATEKSYLPIIDFSESYGLMYGIHLRKGTNDKLGFKVRDNLTGLTTFNAQCFGIRL